MAKFPKPLNMAGADIQVMQSVVNNYKSMAQQLDAAMQEFKQQVHDDLKLLLKEVPELKPRLRVSDDGYEIMDPEP